MKVLLLNGSPKKQKSCTFLIAESFLSGIKKALPKSQTEIIHISDLNVKPCLGCLSCWGRTEGECIIKNDDIPLIKQKILDSDIVVEAFPLYFFGMPGSVKVFTDRMLSMMKTYEGQRPPENGVSYHGIRDKGNVKKFAVLSSCAYTDGDTIFEPLKKQFDYICGETGYTFLYAPQLKTLVELGASARLTRYLQKFESAGEKFALGTLTEDDVLKTVKPPFSDAVYAQLLSNFWTEERSHNKK